MFEREIQIWPKVLLKKVSMQCTKMKTHTKACYSGKITKTNRFLPNLVTSVHETDYFLFWGFQWDSHIFQMLPLIFREGVNKYFHFSHTEVTQIIKGN